MAKIGDIRIRIGGDIKSLEKSLGQAERRLKRSGERFARLGDQMTSGITFALAAAGFGAVKSAGDFQDLENSMISAMGSAESAKEEIKLLRQEALKPGLNFKQAVLGSVRLQAVETDAELARRGIAAYGNALALAGKKGQDLDGVTLALSQIASKGKISAEELNQIAERVPQIRKVLKDAFGTADSEQLQGLGIGFEEFLSKTILELEKLPKAKAGINTFLENIKLDFQETFAVIGQRVFPIIKEISATIAQLAKAFTALPIPIQDNIVKFALLAAVAGPVLKIYGSLKILSGTLVGATGSLVGSFGTLFSTKKRGIPIGLGLAKVYGLLTGVMSGLTPLLSTTALGFVDLGKKVLFASGTALVSFGQTLLLLSTGPITVVKNGLATLQASVINFSKSLLLTASISIQTTKISILNLQQSLIGMGKSLVALSSGAVQSARASFVSLSGTVFTFGKNLSTITTTSVINFGRSLVVTAGTSMIAFGKSLQFMATSPIVFAKTSFTGLTIAVSRFGNGLLFAARKPIQAMRLAMISLGTTLAGITLPISLIVAGIAAFGVAVAANIGPARKMFVDLSNGFIDLYKNSIIVRGGFEAIAFAGKSLFSVVVNLGKIFFETFKGIGKTIAAILKGDFSSIAEIVSSSFEKIKTAGSQIGEDVGKAFSNAVDKTINGREDLSFITEGDVQKTVDKASKIIKGVNNKLFGVQEIETPDVQFTDLTGKTFDRDAKSKKKKVSSKEQEERGRITEQLGNRGILDLSSGNRNESGAGSIDEDAFNSVFDINAEKIKEQNELFQKGLNEHIEKVTKLSDSYNKLGETLTPLQSTFVSLGNAIGDNLAQGVTSFRDFARATLSAISDVIGGLIKQGVTAAAANALKSVPFPFNIAAAGAAGGLASGLFKGLINKVTPPKLAAGGIVSGRTLVEVGEYQGVRGNPEVIAPLNKLKSMLQPAGGAQNITLKGEFRLDGTDLILAVDRNMQNAIRVQGL